MQLPHETSVLGEKAQGTDSGLFEQL